MLVKLGLANMAWRMPFVLIFLWIAQTCRIAIAKTSHDERPGVKISKTPRNAAYLCALPISAKGLCTSIQAKKV